MAFEKYGGHIWSDDPAYPDRDWKTQTASLGIAAAAGIGAFAAATRVRADGTRALDDISSVARTAGNWLPWQIGNTFRIPELLSPFTSPAYQGMTPTGVAGQYSYSWGQKHLQTSSTYYYLKELTGLSTAEMASAGLGIKGSGFDTATELIFERGDQSAVGRLYTVVDGQKQLLQRGGKPVAAVMQQFTGESPDLINIVDKTKSVNRVAHATFQAMDMWQHMVGFQPGDVFRRKGKLSAGEFERPKFFPVPAITADISSPKDLLRSSTLLRALPAFSMERFNRLIEGFAESTVGDTGVGVLKNVFGSVGVTPGPASSMYLRFGGKAAMVLGAGIGIQQLDWARRQFGLPGEMLASAGVSAGLGWLSKKAKFSGRTSLAIGTAAFFGQMILPGFDKGIVPGLASVYARSTELRGNDFNPFNYYRRTLEGFLPGITDWKTGALLGVGALAVGYAEGPNGKTLSQTLADFLGNDRLGIAATTSGGKAVRKPLTVRQHFWQQMWLSGSNSTAAQNSVALKASYVKALKADIDASDGYLSYSTRMRLMNAYRGSGVDGVSLSRHMNAMWAEAERLHKDLAPRNRVSEALLDSLDTIGAKYSGKTDLFSKIGMQVEGIMSQWKHAMLGATPMEKETALAMRAKGFKAPLGRLGLIFGGTLLGHQLVTGGLFGSMETAQELRDIYSGRELVEVGKSRWWEGGGTSFEGSKTSYYRPHWYALMMNRVREKGIWGEGEDETSPISKFLIKNFTYDLERMNYYDRPYPITSAAFSDIPIIGGVLAATIGQIIKPPKLMHVGEWIRPGGESGFEYASVYEGWRREPAYNLGAPGPGVPSSPFSPLNQATFLNYQFRELEGMTGWAKNVLSDLVVGTDTYFTGPQLAESGMMTSPRLRFWENAMGGGFFMNEAVRRIFPNYRKEIDRQNPIVNNMPSWLPEQFRYGDPYRSVEWGEARLPGSGYEALHPELKGTAADDYPLIYQYDILANVAPFSKEFRTTRSRLYKLRANQQTTQEIDAWMDQIDLNVRERYNIYDFERVHNNAIQLPGSNITQSAYFYAQKTLRKGVAPAEYIMPFGFRPISKLMGDRDPIERYEFERMYGTPMAFWDQPWRDWFRPAMYSAMNVFGFESKPLWRRDADENAAYFDQVTFMKWMNLAEQAGAEGRYRDQIRYEYMAGNTRTGVNPQGNPLGIYWAMPSEDRAFFNSFALAQGADRQRILEMVPEDQTHLYKAIWSRMDEGDPSFFASGPTGPDRYYMQKQFYGMQGLNPAPPEDWIGWHEDVDIRDIRVRYVDELGKDLHDYGLWENQLRAAKSQPYLVDSTSYLHDSGGIGRGNMYEEVYDLFSNGNRGPQLLINSSTSGQGHVGVEYNDYRDFDMRYAVEDYLDGY